MRNRVLLSLAGADRLMLEADCKDVTLAAGDVLYEPNYPVDWVYFPQTAVLSVVTVMLDGRTIESDTIGCESVVGALAALGGSVSTSRTFTQIPGLATRMAASRLRRHAERAAAGFTSCWFAILWPIWRRFINRWPAMRCMMSINDYAAGC